MKKIAINISCLLLLILILSTFAGFAQSKSKGDVFVDKNGIMRWEKTKEEVKGFGVNYSAPFAHAYRTAGKLDIDLKKAIDNDVYHFSRLGFDLYRIHVWDTEISDAEGNLLENENLAMFDYLLKQLKDREINFVITPIAYWGNGWPEPDEETSGFSYKYGKEVSLTDPAAIKAQENYLEQFLNHVNPHTGVAYKNEPNIIAFEISNEPHHKGTPKEVTEFVEKMVKSMRKTGTRKPIFYNVSHSTHLMEAYFDADIQGGTFQWYPTGLGFQKELEGNLLPNVDDYNIPFDHVIEKNKAAKLVYEFDAADVMRSYIYPAMARSFREAGIQLATHFAYDPTYMAHANTEYNTHYMNLNYTPQKALALMISGEVFHRIPMNNDFGVYPQNKTFGDFQVDYEKDLAELNAEKKFIYTNTTSTVPKALNKLEQIAGYGNSPVVTYEGRGAYFLDKLEDGVWRLEVMPDAVLIDNPFGKNNLEKTVAVIKYNNWKMNLNIPDLGKNFTIRALDEGNTYSTSPEGISFNITPGTYLLSSAGRSTSYTGSENWKNGKLMDFYAADENVKKTYLVHDPVPEVFESSQFTISAEIISNEDVQKAEVWLQNGNTYKSLNLNQDEGYTYSAEVPSELLDKGFLNYRIIVTTPGGTVTFPGGAKGDPGQWDFYDDKIYSTRVIEKGSPVYLFNAATNVDFLVAPWNAENKLVPANNPGEAMYQVRINELFEVDEENKNAVPIYDYSMRYNFQNKLEGKGSELGKYNQLVIKAKSLSGKPEKIQIALLDNNGAAFGKTIEILPEKEEYFINLTTLNPVKTVTLPRPYPSFLPYYFDHQNREDFNIGNIESLQLSIGPGLDSEEKLKPHEIGIYSVRLEK